MIDFTFFVLIIFAILALTQGNLYVGIGLFVIAILVTKDKFFSFIGIITGTYFVLEKYFEWNLPGWVDLLVLAIIMVLILRNMKEEPQAPQYYQ